MKKKADWGERLAFFWIAFLAVTAVAAPLFLKSSSEAMNFGYVLEAPSWAHLLGTDSLGRDLLSRLLVGGSVSLGVSLIAVLLALVIGTWLGALAGYYGGFWEKGIMGLVDVLLCFPVFFLILAVIAVLGPSILNVMIILGLTGWMGIARLARAEILSLKEREYVLAARVLGAGDFRIIFRHLLPNAMGPVIVNAVLGVSAAILTETALSFLGIGVQPPVPSWGNILTDSKATLGVAWWLTLFPGLMIFLTVLSFNSMAESFLDRLGGVKGRQ